MTVIAVLSDGHCTASLVSNYLLVQWVIDIAMFPCLVPSLSTGNGPPAFGLGFNIRSSPLLLLIYMTTSFIPTQGSHARTSLRITWRLAVPATQPAIRLIVPGSLTVSVKVVYKDDRRDGGFGFEAADGFVATRRGNGVRSGWDAFMPLHRGYLEQ